MECSQLLSPKKIGANFYTIKHYYLQLQRLLSCCDLCGNTIDGQGKSLLCSHCLTDLPLFNQNILQADLLNWPAINRVLPNIYFDQLFCLSPYLAPFTQWLPQFKYQGRFELASLFAELLAKQWYTSNQCHSHDEVPLVLSVPLHISKWQLRGYNQAHLIAKEFASELQLAYQPSALIRMKKNISQVGQSGSMRRKNLRKAFALIQTLPPKTKHVILVDDVVTTGSTASEISQLLKQSGVEKITVVAVCLTLPK